MEYVAMCLLGGCLIAALWIAFDLPVPPCIGPDTKRK